MTRSKVGRSIANSGRRAGAARVRSLLGRPAARPLVPASGGKFPHGCRDPGDACCFVEPHARERTTVEVPGSAAPRVAVTPNNAPVTRSDRERRCRVVLS